MCIYHQINILLVFCILVIFVTIQAVKLIIFLHNIAYTSTSLWIAIVCQFRVDKSIMNTVHAKENLFCCHINSISPIKCIMLIYCMYFKRNFVIALLWRCPTYSDHSVYQITQHFSLLSGPIWLTSHQNSAFDFTMLIISLPLTQILCRLYHKNTCR